MTVGFKRCLLLDHGVSRCSWLFTNQKRKKTKSFTTVLALSRGAVAQSVNPQIGQSLLQSEIRNHFSWWCSSAAVSRPL